MIAMIFEYKVDERHRDFYQSPAALMRELVTQVNGFLTFERFNSATDEDKILALAFFESEDAVALWRNSLEHRKAQKLGRARYFTEYRLRMATVTRDYTKSDRAEAPSDSKTAQDELQ
ncbi:MAG: antibiotic biosynthesis monooxygenase [Kiloniellales bacterium]|nr:antibiotic biosynthesis monooxygenase [Kiloniellales bacterium]